VPRFNQMTAVAFSDILCSGLGFAGCGLVNITDVLSLNFNLVSQRCGFYTRKGNTASKFEVFVSWSFLS